MKKQSFVLLMLLSFGLVSAANAAQDEAQKDTIRKSAKAHLAAQQAAAAASKKAEATTKEVGSSS